MQNDHSSSSVLTHPAGQGGPSKLEQAVVVSPSFFVFVAGVVFLTRSLDLYSVCDASLMFLISIGWVVGCRKIAQQEKQLGEAASERQRIEQIQVKTEDKSRVSEERLDDILVSSPLIMGAVELDGNTVRDLYENAESERFFAKVLAADEATNRSLLRAETIFGWLKRYQETSWIKKPVQFDYEYSSEEGSRWLSVSVSQTGEATAAKQRYCFVAEDVSDRKKHQRALVRSQELLTGILDTHPETIFLLDGEWRLSYMNAAASEALGQGRENIGRVFWELFPQLIGTEVWTQYSRAMTERTAAEFDVFEEHSDKRMEVRAHPYQGGLAIFLRDVTRERQRNEAFLDNDLQLRMRLEELENLYQSNPLGLALFDRNLRFARINETLAGLHGVRIEEVLGRPLLEVLPSSYELLAPVLNRVVETGEPTQVQFSNAKRSYGEPWQQCLTLAYPFKDKAGRIAGVNLVLQDTTAESRVERALRASEERFRQLAEALPDIIWTADAQGNIDYCNNRWYAYTKFAGSNAHSEWHSFIHPADLGKWREAWTRSLRAGENCELEYQFLRHDGVYRWFQCRAQAVFNVEGEIVKWLGVCTDIHQRKRTEPMLLRSGEDLKQLAAAATQDLQEHLRSLNSFCQLARQQRGQIAAEAETYLETILAAATPMNLLLENLQAKTLVNAEQQRSAGA